MVFDFSMPTSGMSSSSSGPRSKSMADVMHILNQLQDVFKATKSEAVQLPQIVVIGPQSSGKSSVLESFVRRSFLPRGIGMVTKCPLVLRLINNRSELKMSSNSSLDESDEFEDDHSSDPLEYVEFGHKKGVKYTDYNLVRQEIQCQTSLKVGKKNGISEDPIIIDVHSPNVANLTLIDLPGFVKMAGEGEDSDIEKRIEELILKYIKNEKSIILAICEAPIDFKCAEALKFAQKVDPQGVRTLAVLTKLDLMDRGTNAMHILNGNSGIIVKLGIIGVVNRSAEDLDANIKIEESLRREQKFLRDNYGPLADRNGTIYLENKLALMLRDHIISCLPQLSAKINEEIPVYEKQLKQIGGDEISHKAETMLRLLTDFDLAYKAELQGGTSNLETRRIIGAAIIRHIFSEMLPENLSKIDPLESITDLDVVRAIVNSRGFKHRTFLAEDAFQTLVKKEIFKIGTCAQNCALLVHKELKLVVKHCLNSSANQFPRLISAIEAVVTELLSERMNETKKDLEGYIETEAAHIKSSDEDFDRKMKKVLRDLDVTLEGFPITELVNIDFLNHHEVGPSEIDTETESEAESNEPGTGQLELSPDQLEKCQAVKNLISDYFQVVTKQAQDHIPRAITATYINHTIKYVLQTLIRKLYPGRADELIRVSDYIIAQREELLRELMELQRADGILREVLETDREM